MSLVLEIEFLLGVVFGARNPEASEPDWPPQPDRIFSALVAAWAARGCREDERDALQWLERLPPPRIAAAEIAVRVAPWSFVPMNDPRSGRSGDVAVLPGRRSRQPRRFPAAIPSDPRLSLVWQDADPDPAIMAALDALARDTASVGHSASLTRCRFHREPPPGVTIAPLRRVYPGRLQELVDAFSAGRRPSPGADVERERPVEAPPPSPTGLFSDRWIVLEYLPPEGRGDDVAAGGMPDLRAAPLVSKLIRATLMAGYQRIGRGDAIPEVISGHRADGSPSSEPHLAVVPLPFFRHRHADGRVMGFALVPAKDSDGLKPGSPAETDFHRALAAVSPFAAAEGCRVMQVRGDGVALRLSPTEQPEAASLRPQSFFAPAGAFATVTPIVLDRHLKQVGEARRGEMIDQIRSACRNAGLPEPAAIEIYKHPVFPGLVSAQPSGRSPPWMGWRLPSSLASRPLTHAVIAFSHEVRGPVLLGAGRHVGLGLCHPLREASS